MKTGPERPRLSARLQALQEAGEAQAEDVGSSRLDCLDTGELQTRLREFIEVRAEYNEADMAICSIEPSRDIQILA